MLFSAFSGCTSENETHEIVPYAPVNISINLNYYNTLNAIGNSLYFDHFNGKALGYMGHGIIIMHTSDGFVAYDATCTNDVYAQEHIEIDGSFAECPLCHSKFNLFDAYPLNNSKARYPLKKYRTSYNAATNTLQVGN